MTTKPVNSNEIIIRPIRKADNLEIEQVIRTVLIEYGANKPGFAWQDEALSQLYETYQAINTGYWVAVINEEIVGGCGIGTMSNNSHPKLCELQKMYLVQNRRGLGIGMKLLQTAMSFAERYYRWCYLETLSTMLEAERLYRRAGFLELPMPLLQTEHSGCDRWYLVDMQAVS